jgi:hypothetical protein
MFQHDFLKVPTSSAMANTKSDLKEERLNLVEPTSARARAVYVHFAETTTFGGVIHTHLSPHWAWKTIWVLIVLALFAATCWNCALVILDYWSYPVDTTVTVSYQPSVPFPTVTVCNRNPVSCLKLTFAYIRHPEVLRELMYFSNCWDSVTWVPLVYRLVIGYTFFGDEGDIFLSLFYLVIPAMSLSKIHSIKLCN